MNLLLGFVTLASLAGVYGQQGDKSTSIIPFPRIGRADRFYMADKRSQGNVSPGLIPFPRIGRSDGNGIHENKRQLIPFPRVGKRPYWHYSVDPYFFEYEDFQYPIADGTSPNSLLTPSAVDSTSTGVEESDLEKRNGAGGNGMWFGPRLGKRRKRSVESESGERSRDSVDTRTLLKILHNFNWAIVPVKERRTFTPRLGRSSEEMGTHHRSPPFSPRLGRSREVSSVELENDEESQNRYSRSGANGHGHSTQSPNSDDSSSTTVAQAPFSPRLGRDHFSPRLGRSSGEDRE